MLARNVMEPSVFKSIFSLSSFASLKVQAQ